ncbi:hypothetical protein [Roseateles sp.]|uniref:hypothetical protein n=1 Tax=Roseateles sp. TaxID=1971397 RepID=UPI00326673F3
MKRILLPLALVFAVSAQAQVISNTKAKVDPKNNKVSNPVVEKPKPKLMSRDELRTCITLQDSNTKEALALKAEQTAFEDNEAKIKAEKVTLDAGEAALSKQFSEVKAEKEAVLAEYAALTAEAPKLDKAALKARNEAYAARTTAFNTMFEAVKAVDTEQSAKRKAFNDKIDARDVHFKTVKEREEKYFDADDKWKAECSKKLYDEVDLKAVRAEMAAASAAGK